MNDKPFFFRVVKTHFFGHVSGYIMDGDIKMQAIENATLQEAEHLADTYNKVYQLGFSRGVIALNKAQESAA